MDETYQIKDVALALIIEESSNQLKTLKGAPNPGDIWNCFCDIYQDDEKINANCDNIKKGITQAYMNALNTVRVTINCIPAPAPTIEPSPRGMGC